MQSGPTKCFHVKMQVPDCNIAILLLIFLHQTSAVQKFPWRFQNSVSVYMYTKTHPDRFLSPWWPGSKTVERSSRSLKLQRKSSQLKIFNQASIMSICLQRSFVYLFWFASLQGFGTFKQLQPNIAWEATIAATFFVVGFLAVATQLPRSNSKPWHPVPMQGKCCWKQKSLGAPPWWMRRWCPGEVFQWNVRLRRQESVSVTLQLHWREPIHNTKHRKIVIHHHSPWKMVVGRLSFPIGALCNFSGVNLLLNFRGCKVTKDIQGNLPPSSCPFQTDIVFTLDPRWRSWILCTKWSSSKSSMPFLCCFCFLPPKMAFGGEGLMDWWVGWKP